MSTLQDRINALKETGTSWSDIAEVVNKEFGTDYDKEALRSKWRRASKKHDEISVNNATRILTADELLARAELDSDEWQIDQARVTSWEQAGANGPTTYYSVKARVSRKPAVESELFVIDVAKQFAALIPAAGEKKPPAKKPVRSNGKMVEIAIPDLHYGKFAWPGETGGESYSPDIAQAMYEGAVYKFSRIECDRFVLRVGDDLFQTDNRKGQTTKGTSVDVSGSNRQHFVEVSSMIVWAIETLRATGTDVEVVMVPGNHDRETTFYLGQLLSAYYRNVSNVIIVNPTAKTRAYTRWGQVLIGHSHTSRKPDRLQDTMAHERASDWAETRWREFHLGHRHTENMYPIRENGSIRVREIPSLSPPDYWHAENEYVSARRAAQAFVWDKEQGLEAIHYYQPSK